MPESQLEPYRDEILTMKTQGMSTAAMQRQIEKSHRVTLKKTQFYDFVNQVTNGEEPEPEEESFMSTKSQPVQNPIDEEARASQHTLLMKLDDVRRDLAKVITWQSQLDEREERREQGTREALGQFQKTLADLPRQLEAALPPPRPVVTPSITSAFRSSRPALLAVRSPLTWKRAMFYTGMLWGVGILLFGYGYWQPLWTLVASLFGSLSASLPLHT